MKRLFVLLPIIFLQSFCMGSGDSDTAIVWGYDGVYNDAFELEYKPFEPPFDAMNYEHSMPLIVGVSGNVKVGVEAFIVVDVTLNGVSVFSHPDTISEPENWETYNGVHFGLYDCFSAISPLIGGYNSTLSAGTYTITFTLHKAEEKTPWLDANGEKIVLEHTFTLFAEPVFAIRYPVFTRMDGMMAVYGLDDVPEFRLELENAALLGPDYFVTATVTHSATPNKKYFVDTIRSAAGLTYTLSGNWRERYGEDSAGNEGDRVPALDVEGNPMRDFHTISFQLGKRAEDGSVCDLTPRNFYSNIRLYFIDRSVAPSIEWCDITLNEYYKDVDVNTFKPIEVWGINPWEGNPLPTVKNGVPGSGPNAVMMRFCVTDRTGSAVYDDTLTGNRNYIWMPSSIAEGTYKVRLSLFTHDFEGNLYKQLDADSNWVEAVYTLILGKADEEEEDSVAVETHKLAGVKVYPNPSNGEFYISASEDARVDVIGIDGTLWESRRIKAGKTEFRIARSGVYLLRITGSSGESLRRVVVR